MFCSIDHCFSSLFSLTLSIQQCLESVHPSLLSPHPPVDYYQAEEGGCIQQYDGWSYCIIHLLLLMPAKVTLREER